MLPFTPPPGVEVEDGYVWWAPTYQDTNIDRCWAARSHDGNLLPNSTCNERTDHAIGLCAEHYEELTGNKLADEAAA